MKLYPIILIPGIALVSACGGGGGSTPEVVNTRVLSKDAGNMGSVNENGTKLTAQANMTSGVGIDWDNDLTGDHDAKFTIVKGENGEAIMTVDGRTVAFSEDDRSENGYGYATENDPNFDSATKAYATLYTYNADSLDDALSSGRSDYMSVWQYYYDDANDSVAAKRGFAVVGTQTDIADVANDPTATYSGWARLQTATTSSYGGWDSETQVQGDLTMSVNFGTRDVSGYIDNMQTRMSGGEWSDANGAAFEMDPTKYNAHGEFAGTVSPNEVVQQAFNLDAGDKGGYAGALFGATAKNIGGTLHLNSDTTNGYGFFGGTKDDPAQ